MTIPAFAIQTSYKPRDKDYVLLLYCGTEPRFPAKGLPLPLTHASAPEKPGASQTAFFGHIDGKSIIARSVRTDSEHEDCPHGVRMAVAEAQASAKGEKSSRIVVPIDGKYEELALAAQEGAILGGYSFDTYLSEPATPIPVTLVVDQNAANLRKTAKNRKEMFNCVNFARDVLNEPPNVIKPASLAAAFQKMGKESGLKVTVWDEKRLAQEECGGILGVGQGAKAKPRLVFGEYSPKNAKKHLCLVGKGVTFDSGGYCLKGAEMQIGMKYDMGGAAMMFAAACAIARTGLPIRISVITPLVENDISGEAYHTTSILKTRTGKTIEVLNTDAEGRLILADALALAAEKEPDWIVDSATLTGACVVALGDDIAGAFGTDPAFTTQIITAGKEEAERFWELPLHMPYSKQMKTTIADCKNMGDSRMGGATLAALFLKQWVPDGIPWVHCDIAGPGCKEKPLDHLGKGAKGFGVKAMVRLAENLSKQ